jgi:alpha-glucoside transport system substrate-binding protein
VVLAIVLAATPANGPSPALAVTIRPLTADCAGSGAGTLLVAGVWTGREAQSFARVLRRFSDRTGIPVTYAYETRDLAAKLAERVRLGCPPDVALLPHPGLLSDLARRGRIQPIDAAAGDLVRRDYAASWQRLATVDGHLYGVWFKAADKSTIWYSKPAFRRAGIARPPRTWDELVADAGRLSAAGIRPFAVAGADGWTLTDWFENLYLRGAGAGRYDALTRHAIPWTAPSVEAALRRMTGLLGAPQMAGTASLSLRTSFEQSVRDVFGRNADAAMVLEGDFVTSFLPADRAQAGVFAFPAAAGTDPGADLVVGGDVAVTFSGTPRADRLIRYLATPAAAAPWVRAGGFLSPNRAVPVSAYPDRLTRQAAALLGGAQTVRFDLSDQQPPAFGATEGQGLWEILPSLLHTPGAVTAGAQRLEQAAAAAFACEKAVDGNC